MPFAIDVASEDYLRAIEDYRQGTTPKELAYRFSVSLETMRKYLRRTLSVAEYKAIALRNSSKNMPEGFALTDITTRKTRSMREKPEVHHDYLQHYNAWMATVSVATPVWAFGGLPEDSITE